MLYKYKLILPTNPSRKCTRASQPRTVYYEAQLQTAILPILPFLQNLGNAQQLHAVNRSKLQAFKPSCISCVFYTLVVSRSSINQLPLQHPYLFSSFPLDLNVVCMAVPRTPLPFIPRPDPDTACSTKQTSYLLYWSRLQPTGREASQISKHSTPRCPCLMYYVLFLPFPGLKQYKPTIPYCMYLVPPVHFCCLPSCQPVCQICRCVAYGSNTETEMHLHLPYLTCT